MQTTLIENLRQGLRDLSSHPMRTGLTALSFGISMAVAVVLISSGAGLRRTITGLLQSMGDGQLVADPGRTTGLAGVSRSGRRVRILYSELEGIRDQLPSFEAVAPYHKLWGTGTSSWKYSIPFSRGYAVGHEYLKVRGFPVTEGRWFTEEEAERGAWVAVVNEGLRKMLFRDHSPLGRWIKWKGRQLSVVGIVRDESSFPYIFYLPYATAAQMSDARRISEIAARPRAGVEWDRSVAEMRRVLAGLGGFDPADERALEIETNREFTEKVRAVSSALNLLVLTIAGVSLLLGGLAVANMMVISVTERTREIGIRKALGATSTTIYTQVLLEAAAVVVVGGLLGFFLGSIACSAIRELPLTATYAASTQLSPAVVAVCLVALALVCLLAGTIPARRAAALVPVEALRWE